MYMQSTEPRHSHRDQGMWRVRLVCCEAREACEACEACSWLELWAHVSIRAL